MIIAHNGVYATTHTQNEDFCIMTDCNHRDTLGGGSKVPISVYGKLHFIINSDVLFQDN